MNSNFFIVFSLPRCGSTAIHRGLNSHSGINCLYEPDFSNADWNEEAVRAEINRIRCEYSGIKHVWDPSGFPFVSTHISSIAGLDSNYDRVLNLNSMLLSLPAKKVLFLRRRNQLERILSDLLGQQTDLWGPAFPDARIAEGLDETKKYQDELKAKRVQPVSLEVIEWYLNNIPTLEDELRRRVPEEDCLDLFYEEIFGPEVGLDRRLAIYQRILDFLGLPTAPSYWDRPTVMELFHPKAKLNDASTLGRIPNLAEVRERFQNRSLTL